MLGDITLGQYYPTGSIIHKLDPRIKIIITFFYIIFLFLIDSPLGYLLALGFVFFTTYISRLSPRLIVKGIAPLKWIIILTFIINLIYTQGQTLFSIGPIDITIEGIQTAFRLSFRLVLLVMGTSILTLTTSPLSLTDGIEGVLSPLKALSFPVHEVAMMMTIALRFIPTLLEETERIIMAQKARGADFESGNLVKRAKNMVPLLVPLILNSIERADELSIAMEARCYRGSEGRSKLNPLRFRSKDIIILLLSLIFFILVIYMEKRFYG